MPSKRAPARAPSRNPPSSPSTERTATELPQLAGVLLDVLRSSSARTRTVSELLWILGSALESTDVDDGPSVLDDVATIALFAHATLETGVAQHVERLRKMAKLAGDALVEAAEAPVDARALNDATAQAGRVGGFGVARKGQFGAAALDLVELGLDEPELAATADLAAFLVLNLERINRRVRMVARPPTHAEASVAVAITQWRDRDGKDREKLARQVLVAFGLSAKRAANAIDTGMNARMALSSPR